MNIFSHSAIERVWLKSIQEEQHLIQPDMFAFLDK